MSDDLVERVARKIAEAYVADVSHGQLTLEDSEYHWSDWRLEARAAIAVCMEEAAKVVALMPRTHTKIKEDHDVLGMKGTWTFTLNNGPAECAAAIRALVKNG